MSLWLFLQLRKNGNLNPLGRSFHNLGAKEWDPGLNVYHLKSKDESQGDTRMDPGWLRRGV